MSESISGYETYVMYLSFKAHFTNLSYNFFKFNGKTRASESTFSTRKDKYYFDKLAHKFSKEKIIEKMLVEQIDNSSFWVKDLTEKDNEMRYLAFRGFIEGLPYSLKKEFSFIKEYCLKAQIEPSQIFKIQESSHPLIFKFLLRKDIRIETFIACDIIMSLSQNMNKKMPFDPIWSDHYNFMLKYYPFVSGYLPEKKEITKMFKDVFMT